MAKADGNKKNRQAETRRAAQMMKRILIHFRGQMDEQLRPQGVTTAQLHVLKTIQNEPVASGAQLARSCYVTPQSAQALLKSLVDGGWVWREKDSVNGRILIARLTPSGEALIETAEKVARVIEGRFWQGIPDSEVSALNEVLGQCLANLEAESGSGQA
ncbi:MAG TPA: MarR family transcriptional regulator [Edaphobacter sp.]|nr:MarR family transcriptional regulator [Edaphobacter sp.]